MALLQKLRGASEFCSEAHRLKYHEEYSRLAMTRLLRSQAKTQREHGTAAVVAVAVPEPVPEETIEETAQDNTPQPAGFLPQYPKSTLPEPTRWSDIQPLHRTDPHREPALPRAGVAIAATMAPPPKPRRARRFEIPFSAALRAGGGGPVFSIGARFSASFPLEWQESLELQLQTLDIVFEHGKLAAGAPPAPAEEPLAPPAPPPRRNEPFRIRLEPVAAPSSRAQRSVRPLAPSALRIHLPAVELLPLRPRIAFLPRAPETAPEPLEREPAARVVPVEEATPTITEPPEPAEETAAEAPPAPVEPAPATRVEEPFGIAPQFAVGVATGWWTRTPLWAKLILLVAFLGGGGWLFKNLSAGRAETKSTAGLFPSTNVSQAAITQMGGGGWITDWAVDLAGSARGRQLSLYRPSRGMKDYVLEFTGQIESKGMGWVFRAADPKNYYAMKLEILTPGETPVVKLFRYAVIDGEEGSHAQVALPFPVREDTVYKVRLEVKGQRFTTLVQGQPIDAWIDPSIKSGGLGFFSDRGERAKVSNIRIDLGL